MTPRRLVSILCPLGLAVLLLALPALAVEKGNPTSIVRVTIDSSALTVEPEEELNNGRLRLLSPEGLEIVRDFKGGFGQITVEDLAKEVDNLSLDGCWTYEIVGTPSLTKTEQSLLAESRETGRPVPADLQLKLESMYETGSFNIKRGIMMFDPDSGETDIDGKLRAEVPNRLENGVGIGGAPTDLITGAEVPTGLDHAQVISGDLVVYNSVCVGFDCPTSPSFGADTIRLQENNLRIHFDDTSTAASFPRRDWRILANDQANGGLSRFSVEDVTGGRIPFTIEAAAPSNALYVEDSGDVGFGTANPVLDIHAVDGDTPALRLEQDGSSGFQPQVWDLAGNETSFFVRDATNGSTLPFRIFPGESSNSLVLRNGGVGVGTLNPSELLHLRGSSQALLRSETSSGGRNMTFGAQDSDPFTHVGTTSNHSFNLLANGARRVRIGVNGGVSIGTSFASTDAPAEGLIVEGNVGIGTTSPAGTLDVDGPIFQRGSQIHADYVFEPEYELESIEEHSAFMWEKKHLPALAPRMVDDEGREIVEIGAQRRGILEELEKAHIYIDELNGTIHELKSELKEKDGYVATLSERLAALEEAMGALQQ